MSSEIVLNDTELLVKCVILSNATIYTYDDIFNKPLLAKRIGRVIKNSSNEIENTTKYFIKDLFDEDETKIQEILDVYQSIANSIAKIDYNDLEQVDKALKKFIDDNK